MAKKINATFTASLAKNNVKGGAWMATYVIAHEAVDGFMPIQSEYSAWTSASAAKRWIKDMVKNNTPKKSIKLLPGDEKDAKGKPVWFAGSLNFKQEL